jgi:hypothetical protein
MHRIVSRMLLSAAVGFVLWTCKSPGSEVPDKPSVPLDTLVKRAIVEEFPMYFLSRFDLNDLEESLDACNKYSHEIILPADNIKLKYYKSEGTYHYSPFVVRVTDSLENLIGCFAFCDEVSYLHNGLHATYSHDTDSIIIEDWRSDTTLFRLAKFDLEKNLNTLIAKLGYTSTGNVQILIKDLFHYSLGMEPLNYYQLEYVTKLLQKTKNRNELTNKCIHDMEYVYSNFTELCELGQCFEAKEGVFGFWQLSVVEENGVPRVKARFFGELLYTSIYL